VKYICPPEAPYPVAMRRWMALPFLLGLALAQEVRLVEGWVRYPASLAVTAAYLTLENPGERPLRLLGAEAAWAERVELHGTFHQEKDGKMVMGMRPVDFAEVPPKGRLVLKPGGYHLMLFNLKRPLKLGEKVELVLKFQNGTQLKVLLPVEAR